MRFYDLVDGRHPGWPSLLASPIALVLGLTSSSSYYPSAGVSPCISHSPPVVVPVPRFGSTVTVVLASTYWQVQGSSDAAVLLLASGPVIAPAAQGICVPGGGCGTVTTVFRAIGPGRASVIAGRTTCGEAMQCTGTNGAFEVTIVVSG